MSEKKDKKVVETFTLKAKKKPKVDIGKLTKEENIQKQDDDNKDHK